MLCKMWMLPFKAVRRVVRCLFLDCPSLFIGFAYKAPILQVNMDSSQNVLGARAWVALSNVKK